MKIILPLLMFVSSAASASEYVKVLDCENGHLVVDRYEGRADAPAESVFQVVVHRRDTIAHLEGKGLSPDLKGRNGEWIFRGLRFGSCANLFERLTRGTSVNVSKPTEDGGVTVRVIKSLENGFVRGEWDFRDCKYSQ